MKNAALTVRISAPVKARLAVRAQRGRRSVSSEIALILEEAVRDVAAVSGKPVRILGLFPGKRVPTDSDIRQARRALWTRLAGPDGE